MGPGCAPSMGATATIVRSWIALRRALGIRHVRFRQDAVAFKVRATSASEYVAARTAYGERDLIASTALALAPDAVFYDIGANVGLYSLAASRRAAKVIAFEPAPANLEALEHNVAVNGARNVRVLGLAIGERDGEMELFLGERGAGSQINSLSPQVVHDSRTRKAEARACDARGSTRSSDRRSSPRRPS